MGPFDRNIGRRVTLIVVLKSLFMYSCVAQTEATIACIHNKACLYDCPAEVVQKHCTSEKEKDGHCCPGYFRDVKSTCQVCRDKSYMPHVNNCCECLPCAECDGIRNNTEVTLCSYTNNTVCKIQDDPPPRGTSACPWIESTSTPTTQVTTTEAVSVNTPRPSAPTGSKSERTYKVGFLVIVGPFILLVVMSLVICICLCYAHHSGGNDQIEDGNDRTCKEVARIIAEKIRGPQSAGSGPANQSGDQTAYLPGGGGQVASQIRDYNAANGPDEPNEPNEHDPLNAVDVV